MPSEPHFDNILCSLTSVTFPVPLMLSDGLLGEVCGEA